MSVFAEALARMTPKQRFFVRSTVVAWSAESEAGAIVTANLNPREHFLPVSRMRKLLLAIYRHRKVEFSALEKSYELECHKHVLKGGVIRCPRPSQVGRVVERQSFLNHLYMSSGGYFVSLEDAEDFLARLIAGDELTERETEIPLSRFAAWVTWDNDAGDGDPFAFAKGNSELLRASLGLDPERRCVDGVLLLRYKAGIQINLVRPTVADAALFLLFEPPDIDFDDHGQTRPWPPGAVADLVSAPTSRPEAVHERQPVLVLDGLPPEVLI